jgi:hypothetical protein
MSLEEIYYVSQTIAAVAIVGSLALVILQLRQSEKTQRALVHQTRADRNVTVARNMVDADVARLLAKAAAHEASFSTTEIVQLMGLLRMQAISVDDTTWQRLAGLLDDAAVENAWQSSKALLALPALRATWPLVRPGIADNLAAEFERRAIQGTDILQAEWGQAWRASYEQLLQQNSRAGG